MCVCFFALTNLPNCSFKKKIDETTVHVFKSNEFRVAVDCVIMLLFIHLSVSILAFLPLLSALFTQHSTFQFAVIS